MAYLTSKNTKFQIYIKSFHQFGRLAAAVDTLIDSPEISRLHAVIEWIDGSWQIRDLSKNGVWLNNRAITVNTPFPLHLNDEICFANQQQFTFIVENLDEPKDVLLPLNADEPSTHPATDPIFLEHYHFLPSDVSPEVIVFYDISEKSWFCECVDTAITSKVDDGELLEFSDSMWKLIKGADVSEKATIAITDKPANELCYIFNISQDEELTELTLKNGKEEINCETRSHHYLTALLARYRGQDSQKQVPDAQQGWRTIEQLTKDIGLSETHVNIQIHRARKQVADKLQSLGVCNPLLIERKRGRVRLAAKNFKIFKGQSLELETTFV